MINRLYQFFFSSQRRLIVDRIILVIAIAGFLIHLGLIYMKAWGVISIEESTGLLDNPIAAAYTPFSFILVYEVYLLVFYIPRSITTYICKQYEIITLIIIRRLFKDLANLEITSNWFEISGDLQFTYDILASLILFYLLFHFKKLAMKRLDFPDSTMNLGLSLQRFILFKRGIAVVLVPLLFGVALYTFSTWAVGIFDPSHSMAVPFSNLNSIFFDEFFTILIIVDVMLLLFSFFLADDFHKIMRNSGFIVSTILIRLSFSVEGLISVVLVISSVLFGLLILMIFYKYEENIETLESRLN
jgi:hypothetical protein